MIGEQAQTLNRGVPERRLAKEVLGKHLQKGGEARPLRNVDGRHSEFAKDGSYGYMIRRTCR